ncbi:DnaA N-terminal domain-containing protein [Sporolactobacillus vineae]|uniref:DnaA N-terminal domain-containing protein n=1 Tax=Sporolactobacillus vineae TaxID=444463 RepID=UPI0002896D8C|nr:DnaA N-terminal domain-containing protein [Sporolactobacillus vineae]
MTDNLDKANEIVERKSKIVKAMTDVECDIVIAEEQASITNHTKLPLSRLTALGTAFEPLAAAFQKVINGKQVKSGYMVKVPIKGHLAEFQQHAGNLGTVLNEKNQSDGFDLMQEQVELLGIYIYHSIFEEMMNMREQTGMWEQALKMIAGEVRPVEYGTWFNKTTATYDGVLFIVTCPNAFTKEWLYEHYSNVILNAVEKVTGNDKVKIGLRSFDPPPAEPIDKSRVVLIDE